MSKGQAERLIGGIALIALGFVFIFNVIFGWGVMWPLFIVFAGVMVITNFVVSGEDLEGAVVGSVVLFTIAGFFLCFTLGVFAWSDMSWLWPVFILAPGLGLIASYFVSRDSDKLIPAVILITLFVVFVFGSSLGFWTYWPVILIVVGIIIVLMSSLRKR